MREYKSNAVGNKILGLVGADRNKHTVVDVARLYWMDGDILLGTEESRKLVLFVARHFNMAYGIVPIKTIVDMADWILVALDRRCGHDHIKLIDQRHRYDRSVYIRF